MSALFGFFNSTKSVFTNREGQLRANYMQFIDTSSDAITYLNVWSAYIEEVKKGTDLKKWTGDNGLDLEVLKEVESVKEDLAERKWFRDAGLSDEHKTIHVESQKQSVIDAVISGFQDKLLEKGADDTFKFADGERGNIHVGRNSGIISTTPYMISGDFRGGKTEREKLWAGMNQVIDKAKYDDIKAKLDKVNAEIAAAAKARGDSEEREEKPTSSEEEAAEHIQEKHEVSQQLAKQEEEERRKEELREEIQQHEEAKAAVETAQAIIDEHAQEHKVSLWQGFKNSVKKIGRGITYPIRKLWEWVKYLFGGGKKGGGHHQAPTAAGHH
jgi:hypothetical protein